MKKGKICFYLPHGKHKFPAPPTWNFLRGTEIMPAFFSFVSWINSWRTTDFFPFDCLEGEGPATFLDSFLLGWKNWCLKGNKNRAALEDINHFGGCDGPFSETHAGPPGPKSQWFCHSKARWKSSPTFIMVVGRWGMFLGYTSWWSFPMGCRGGTPVVTMTTGCGGVPGIPPWQRETSISPARPLQVAGLSVSLRRWRNFRRP